MKTLCAVLLSLATLQAFAVPPGEGVVLAAQDIGRLDDKGIPVIPPEIRPYIRYLVLDDPDSGKILNGHTNQLSRSQDIVQAVHLEGKVMRINILDYGWDLKTWELLADADPYYHADLDVGGKKVRALSPILAEGVIEQTVGKEKVYHNCKENIEYLVSQTKSKAPILRADWFFNQTAIQADRGPTGYYDFLRVKDEKDFQRMIGFDAKLARDFGKVLRESVSVSGVTHQARAFEIQKAQGGWYLKSYDFIRAVGKKNPLRVLGEDISKEADATEQYGALPNGLWATFLANGKGERQDSAPDKIASDSFSKSTDKRVHINASCTRCHVQGGVQPLDGFIRNLAHNPLLIGSPDYQKHLELRREYLKSLTVSLETARLLYEDAIKEATGGWDSATYAQKYGSFWSAYEDAHIDLAWAARDLNLKADVLKGIIERRIAAGYIDPSKGGPDYVLANFVAKTPKIINIRTWEEVFQLAHIIIRGERP